MDTPATFESELLSAVSQADAQPALLHLADGFGQLPASFYTRVATTPLASPTLVAASEKCAHLLGLDASAFKDPALIEALAGNRTLPGSAPLSAVYSGHQFGVWAGQLGDGRAHLLGEVRRAGQRWELQLKGAGRTPYSRMGDGRAVLRSSIREFLCSEAMHGLGIPTTRALCVIGSPDPVLRETVETAAVVTRVAQSFVRFGSFEHWFQRDREAELRILADYVIEGFYPAARSAANPYAQLLAEVATRTARLVAHWQAVGFCHGVMNTDNMSILGLTLDYGPFGFMESFASNHICNHSDEAGRYAYGMQPRVAHWNLYCLAQALMPLIGKVEAAEEALGRFKPEFDDAMAAHMRAKLGLATAHESDELVINALFALLDAQHPDFTLFFRRLCELSVASSANDGALRDLFVDRAAFDTWAVLYRTRLQLETRGDSERALAMRAVNPKFVLRNYLAERAIVRARENDFAELARLLSALEHPYDEQSEHDEYAALPPDWASGLEVSCSS